MGKYHDRINWKKELRLLPGYIIVCAWVARLRQPFLNKGNSDGPCCGLFQWPEVG